MSKFRLALVRVAGVGASVSSLCDPSKYHEAEASLYLQYARASFCSRESVEKWSCGSMCEEAQVVANSVRFFDSSASSGQGYVAQVRDDDVLGTERTCVVAFRGSVDALNYVYDSKFWHTGWPNWPGSNASNCPGCKVHSGVADAYVDLRAQMWEHIQELRCLRFGLAGHSLGGGLAALAALDIRLAGHQVDKVYTYGKLRVGNDAFVKMSVTSAEKQEKYPPMWRLVNHHDPVPRVPFQKLGYVHPPLEVYYSTETPSNYQVCCPSPSQPENHTCSWSIGVFGCLSNPAHDHNTYLNMSTIGTDLPAACVGGLSARADKSPTTSWTPSADEVEVVV